MWTIGGDSVAKRLIFPVAYLVLMVPLPFIDRYTLPLAMFTGVCSGGLARILGLDVEIIGNAVKLPNADLVIGAQCSGVNSLIALTALMVLAAYVVDGPNVGTHHTDIAGGTTCHLRQYPYVSHHCSLWHANGAPKLALSFITTILASAFLLLCWSYCSL